MLFDAHRFMRFHTWTIWMILHLVDIWNKNHKVQNHIYEPHNTGYICRVIEMGLGSSWTWSQNTSQVRQVTCSVHPGRPCQPCKQGNLSKFFHPKSWKNKALIDQLRELERSIATQLDSCICRPCRDETTNHGFVPRWRKVKWSQHYYVLCCSDPVQRVTKLVNKEPYSHWNSSWR